MKMEDEEMVGSDIESDSQKMRRTQHLHFPDYSGLYANTQKHMLDFDDLDLSQRNLEVQNTSQTNGFLGEQEEYENISQKGRLRDIRDVEPSDLLNNSQVLAMREHEFAMAVGGGQGQGVGQNQRFLPVPGNSLTNEHLGLNTAQPQPSVNEGENNFSGLCDAISTDQENDLLNMIRDGPGFAADLLSQGSIGSLSNFILEQEAEATDSNTKEPLGSETISLEKFEGPFSFNVVPIDKGKSCFCPEYNKFYCDMGTYGFIISLNFEEIRNLEKYVIRVALVFTDPHFQNIPVVKCVNCAETQKKFLNEKEKEMVANHIVRGHSEDSQVTYVTSNKTKYSYAMIGLSQPEPGCSTLVQKLVLTCRSSCKSDEMRGINRRATALVFTLLNNQKAVCGRSVINLRICSAPIRDFKSEFKDAAIAYQQRQGKKRKSVASPVQRRTKGHLQEVSDDDDDDETVAVEPIQEKMRVRKQKEEAKDVETSPVKRRANHKEDRVREADSSGSQYKVAKVEAAGQEVMGDHDPVPSTSTNSNLKATEPFDLEKAIEMLYNSSQESSSQESVVEYEDEDGIRKQVKLRTHYKECRKVLHWIKSNDALQRAAAIQVFESLKLTEQLCSKSKKMIKELQTRSDSANCGDKQK